MKRYLLSFINFFIYLFKSRDLLPGPWLTYTMRAGHHYCDRSVFRPVKLSYLRFSVLFSGTSLYTTQLPINQQDINKLLGFTDGTWRDHKNSARFGWNVTWENNIGVVHIHGYVYAGGERLSQEICALTDWYQPVNCLLTVYEKEYLFEVKGYTPVSIPRVATGIAVQTTYARMMPTLVQPVVMVKGDGTPVRLGEAKGVLLYPYFGGDEKPNRNVSVQIKLL